MEPELIDAIGDYLLTHVERHGHARTAEAFSVSRHTLWRFLERGQPGRTLPGAVMAKAGDTPEAIAAATRALADETTLAPSQRPVSTWLMARGLQRALRALCETPFATVDELSRIRRVPASTLRARLARLRERGLADARPHRLKMLSARPQQRYFPTAAGVAALGEATADDVPRLYPVSRQWFRLLGERLDSVACVYALTALIADVDPEQDRVRVDHYRHGPYDALVTLSGGRSLGVLRQGPMLTSASLRYRIRTIERLGGRERPRHAGRDRLRTGRAPRPARAGGARWPSPQRRGDAGRGARRGRPGARLATGTLRSRGHGDDG